MPSLAETPNNDINTFVFQLYIVQSVGFHCCLFHLPTCWMFFGNDIYYETFKYLQTTSKLPQDYAARMPNMYYTLLSFIHTYIHTQGLPTFSFLVHPRVNTSSREYLTLYNIIIHYLLSIKSSSWFLYKRITIWSCNHSFKCYTCIAPNLTYVTSN